MKTQIGKRFFAIVVISGLITSAFAAEANAASWKDGNVACSQSQPFSFVKTKTKGTWRAITAPGTGYAVNTYNMNPNMYITGIGQGVNRGGYWKVNSNNNVDTGYTTGYCQNYG